MSVESLSLTALLILVPIIVSYYQKLGIIKDLVVAVIRGVVQLTIVGYILEYVFKVTEPVFIYAIVAVLVFNAAWNTRHHAPKFMVHVFWMSFASILFSTYLTVTVLILTGALKFTASQVISVSAMITYYVMTAISLCYDNMNKEFQLEQEEITSKLALGATPNLAAKPIISDVVKTALIPTIDMAKTLGIVSLPGMMTGMIIAGARPLMAIRFQLMVTFMLLGSTTIGALIVVYAGYRQYFTQRDQLRSDVFQK